MINKIINTIKKNSARKSDRLTETSDVTDFTVKTIEHCDRYKTLALIELSDNFYRINIQTKEFPKCRFIKYHRN